MSFLKTVGGKVVGGLVALAVIIAVISWYEIPSQTRSEILSSAGRIVAWVLIIAVVPWLSFGLIRWVGSFGTNSAGSLLVAALTLVEFLLLLWMFKGQVHGTGRWAFVGVGVLLAAAYNLFACDWIAERYE